MNRLLLRLAAGYQREFSAQFSRFPVFSLSAVKELSNNGSTSYQMPIVRKEDFILVSDFSHPGFARL